MISEDYFKEVHFYSKDQLATLKNIYKQQYGVEMRVTSRDDFKQWNLYVKTCLSTFTIFCILTILGLLALYTSTLAGWVERIPTLEELILGRVSDEVRLLFPQDQEAFFNIQAGCFSGTLSPCQLQLVDPFSVVDQRGG